MTDNVNDPQHYQFSNGAHVIDITENLNFNRGNVIKYVARAGRKDPANELEDLEKARFYLNREIERLAEQEGHRYWLLLDHVPPGVTVRDRDQDEYRRISGTGKFQMRYWNGQASEYGNWFDVPGWLYKDQAVLAPFKEVAT